MSSDPSLPTWELSKENIQPLRGGRKVSSVGLTVSTPTPGSGISTLGPSADKQKAIRETKSAFEEELRLSGSSDDSLDPWYRYILWVEQTFPKGGQEAKLNVLIQKCISEFKDNDKFNQDPRYLDVWIKYATSSSDPMEIYKFMYVHNWCTTLPDLYTNWAWEAEQLENFVKAEQIFNKGLEKVVGEEERKLLKRKQELFQARVMKKVLEKSKDEELGEKERGEEEREVLGALRGHGKKQIVDSVRIGNAKKAGGAGGVFQEADRAKPKSNTAKTSFGIYQDENQPRSALPPMTTTSASEQSLPFAKKQNQENDLGAGKWTSSRIGKKSHAVPLNQISSRPSFDVHVDEGLQQPTKTPLKMESNILSTKKNTDDDVPLAIFEPPDPSKRPMYCKHLVYQGTTEYSFEELRAIRFRKRFEEKRLEKMAEETERKRRALLEEENKLLQMHERIMKEQEERFAKLQEQEERFAKWQEQVLAAQEEKLKKLQQEESEEEEEQRGKSAAAAVNVYQDPNDESATGKKSLQNSSVGDSSNSKKSVFEETALLLHASSKGCSSTGNSWQKTPPRTNDHSNVCLKAAICQPSPTVNTKEAINLVQKMWGKTDDDSELKEMPVIQEQFKIYSDCEENENQRQQPKPRSGFEIFCDTSEKKSCPERISLTNKKQAKPTFGVRVPVEDKENVIMNTSDKENQDPLIEDKKDKLEARRPLSGILQPSTNVKSIPLEIQEAILDEDEKRQENELSSFETMPPPPPTTKFVRRKSIISKNPNMTIALPSMEDFEARAEIASTPFNGRGPFLVEDNFLDENTCKIDIVTKAKILNHEEEVENEKLQSDEVMEKEAMATHGQQQQQDADNNELNLSPIMETSREHNYKSSSSSGPSMYQHHQLTKSHWGNTQLGHTTVPCKTPGAINAAVATSIYNKSLKNPELTCSSGYMADSSSARTPGMFLKNNPNLQTAEKSKMTRELDATPHVDEKRQKMSQSCIGGKEEEEEEEEPMTGCIGDMMNQFKKEVKNFKAPNKNASTLFADEKPASSFLQESLKENYSFLDKSKTMPFSNKSQFSKLSFADFSKNLEAEEEDADADPQLEITGPNFENVRSNVSIRLEESAMSQPEPDESIGEENEEASTKVPEQELSLNMSQMKLDDMQDVSDPFDESLQARLLQRIRVPVCQRHGYARINTGLPQVRSNKTAQIGNNTFLIGKCRGEGSYGKVFKALKMESNGDTTAMNETISDMDVVLKIQKPACEWEFYICTEIHERLGSDSEYHDWFMSIPRCFTYNNGSVFVSEHHKGTLLDFINQDLNKISQTQYETAAMYFVIEMLIIAQKLKEMEIIHGDIKPDNFLIQNEPRLDKSAKNPFKKLTPVLQLIDFGRCIDMKMFPKNQTFVHSFEKTESRTPEMLDEKPWTYQVDYFGIACTAYVILSGSYMKLTKKNGKHFPSGVFRRWWNSELWTDFFNDFLNVPNCNEQPDLVAWRERFEDFFIKVKMTSFVEFARTLNV